MRAEVRDAKNNDRHACGRARNGERPVPYEMRFYDFATATAAGIGSGKAGTFAAVTSEDLTQR